MHTREYMNILIIDNGSSHIDGLEAAFRGHDVIVKPFSDVDLDIEKPCDAIVLSGGHGFPVIGNENRLAPETEIVKRATVPVLGICYGCELIARAYGSTLEQLEKKEEGVAKVRVIQDDPIFNRIDNFNAYEGHRWAIKKVGADLNVLAESESGIEAIKHKSKLVYGVQFHPEVFKKEAAGTALIRNFLSICRESEVSKAYARQ